LFAHAQLLLLRAIAVDADFAIFVAPGQVALAFEHLNVRTQPSISPATGSDCERSRVVG
jgi:hypothetical protein